MTLLLMLLLKSFLVFALSGVVLLCLRRASASARHLVCLLTLAALLTLPLFSLTLPGWHVAALSSTDSVSGNTTVGALLTAPSAPAAPSASSTSSAASPDLVPHNTAEQEGAASSAPTATATKSMRAVRSWLPLLLVLYLLGLLLASVRPLLGLWGIAHLRRTCVSATDAPTLGVAADCAAALGLPRLPQLCRADVPVPMTWGWLRPVVLLPSGSEAWLEDRLRSVLLHELAHVKRRDWPCHRFADFACALYWFHPLVWLTARRLRAESEAACDDLVLSSGIAAPDYARHLLEIAGALSRPLPGQSAIAMAQTPHIKRRILMVLDKTLTRRTMTRRALVFGAALGAAALVPLAMLRPAASAQTAPAVAGAVQLVAIADASALSGQAWDQAGNVLSATAFLQPFQDAAVKISAPPGQKALAVAFHIPTPFQQSTRIAVNDSDAPLGRVVLTASKNGSVNLVESASSIQTQLSGGSVLYMTGFPAALTSASFLVGVASGQGVETANCPKTVGKVSLHKAAGDVIFTLLPHPQGGAAFMVSDHFRSLSPLKADNPLQVALHDAENYERSVYALDKSGKVLARLPVTPYTWPDTPDVAALDYRSIKTQQTGHLSSVLLRRTASFRLVARPYQWTEFKNVALQPVK